MVTCPTDQDRSTQYTGTINDDDADDDGDYEDDDGGDEEEVEEEDSHVDVIVMAHLLMMSGYSIQYLIFI